jgi:hypothetical protein
MNLSQQEGDDRENTHDFDERETFLNVFTARQLRGNNARMVRYEIFRPDFPFDYWTYVVQTNMRFTIALLRADTRQHLNFRHWRRPLTNC